MRRFSGMTLVELIITLAVAIALLAVGMPALTTLFANSRSATEINDMAIAFQYARSEAVKRGTPIEVCAGNGTAAVPTPTACSDANDWSAGILITSLAGGEILRRYDALAAGVTATEIGANPGISRLRFRGNGRPVDAAGTPAGLCVAIVRSGVTGRNARRWIEVMEATGRVRPVDETQYVEVQTPDGACPVPTP